jgi:small ubiquitin-related modifier
LFSDPIICLSLDSLSLFSGTTPPPPTMKNSTNVQSYMQTGEETFFKIKKTTRMEKVFTAYAGRRGVAVGSLRFLLDGEKIGIDQTPKMLELEDQDQIDCMLEQVRVCLFSFCGPSVRGRDKSLMLLLFFCGRLPHRLVDSNLTTKTNGGMCQQSDRTKLFHERFSFL